MFRRILLVDCDAFFVQVARLEDPEGAGREPLLIVGGSASGRGVVTSASYETRRFGVHSAMPTARALQLCPDATVVPVPREACGRKSRAVRSVLGEEAPVVEAASIDEFYLDMGGTERLLGENLEAVARPIRERVLERTGISVSIGGGTTKLVAKLATGRAKPAGVHVVPAGREEAFLRTFRLEELPGVGPSLAESLRRRGLETVEDALPIQEEWLRRWLGERRGAWLHRRIRGRDDGEVDPSGARKSVSSERTFSKDLDDADALEAELLRLAASVGRSLREEALRTRTVTVKVRDPDFTTRQASHTLPEPVESDRAVYSVARGLLAELRQRRRRPLRLLGVAATNLVDRDEPEQLGLFGGEVRTETERDRTVSRLVDDLRERFGREAIVPGRIVE